MCRFLSFFCALQFFVPSVSEASFCRYLVEKADSVLWAVEDGIHRVFSSTWRRNLHALIHNVEKKTETFLKNESSVVLLRGDSETFQEVYAEKLVLTSIDGIKVVLHKGDRFELRNLFLVAYQKPGSKLETLFNSDVVFKQIGSKPHETVESIAEDLRKLEENLTQDLGPMMAKEIIKNITEPRTESFLYRERFQEYLHSSDLTFQRLGHRFRSLNIRMWVELNYLRELLRFPRPSLLERNRASLSRNRRFSIIYPGEASVAFPENGKTRERVLAPYLTLFDREGNKHQLDRGSDFVIDQDGFYLSNE